MSKKFNLKKDPVVTMLGHVNHGKTSLLDCIRGTNVQASEAGGITQVVRAHQIEHKIGNESYKITFIDTPGHEAFSKMRERGAKVTDIAVLVVACDDGIQPQTKEAIKFAKEANVPIIVALNKIDIEGVDKTKILRQLSENGVLTEEFGGNVIAVETSAKKKIGIDKLLETILLVAELNEIAPAKEKGNWITILESNITPSQGCINLALVDSGVITKNMFIGYNGKVHKIRAIKNEKFEDIETASISTPIWILGLTDLIEPGISVEVFEKEKDAKSVIQKVCEKADNIKLTENLDEQILENLIGANNSNKNEKKLNIILKAESQGTLEVVKAEIAKLAEDSDICLIESKIGDITKEDILRAKDLNAIVIGFRTNLCKSTQLIAKKEGILVKNYEIIYEMIQELAEVALSLVTPIYKKVTTAKAVVKKVFTLSNKQIVAGCKVLEGTILKGNKCRVEREGKTLSESKIFSIKQLKNEVKEIKKGNECGIILDPQVEIQEGDEIICFKLEKETV